MGSRIALVFAGVWSIGLLVGAVTLPAYQRQSATYSSTVVGPVSTTSSSATLVEENGSGALAVVAIPLAICVGIAFGLWRRRRSHRPGPGAPACVLSGVLLLFCLVSMLTIGVFVLPVAAALVTACVLAP